MKAVILAGGLGSRISEETETRPKPMIEIGGRPILWHIMKMYAAHGIDEFVVCLGYKGYVIKEFFANYYLHSCDVTFDLARNAVEVHQSKAEPWRVTLVDTGESTMTGGRLQRVLDYVGDEEFCFTYGDGVSNVDLTKLVEFHRSSGTIATVTAVQPPGRFGALDTDGEKVTGFSEKPHGDGGWINGGFFVLNPEVRRYLNDDDQLVWEREPLEGLARDGELSLYRHDGFWQPMDTRRELLALQSMWEAGTAPWRTWT
jgi:glucose-1-phosphate cytidylyltransferase